MNAAVVDGEGGTGVALKTAAANAANAANVVGVGVAEGVAVVAVGLLAWERGRRLGGGVIDVFDAAAKGLGLLRCEPQGGPS